MNALKLTIFGAALALSATTAAQAQNVVDMSKFTCEQLLGGSGNSIEAAVWISGYYNGLYRNTKLDLDMFQHNAETVVAECRKNPGRTVMRTINSLVAPAKKAAKKK